MSLLPEVFVGSMLIAIGLGVISGLYWIGKDRNLAMFSVGSLVAAPICLLMALAGASEGDIAIPGLFLAAAFAFVYLSVAIGWRSAGRHALP